MFQSLRFRDFRLLWLGLLISNLGTWSQLYAEQWYIYQFNKSSLDVGLLVFVQAVPNILFMLLGGVLADRFNRRKLLFFTQGSMAFLTVLLAVLISLNIMELPLYLTINFLYGLLIGLDIPARRSIVPNIIPPEFLTKALSLYNATFQIALFIGPVVGAYVVTTFGYKLAYDFNALSFIAILFAVWRMNIPTKIQNVQVKHTLFTDLKQVGTVLREYRVLPILLVMNFTFVALGRIDYLFPSLATSLLHVGVNHAGWLNSSLGIGYVIGSLTIGTLDQKLKRKTVYLLFWNCIVLGGTALLLSTSTSLWGDSIVLAIRGVFISISGILISTLLQTRTPDEHMGKVMGFQNAMLSAAGMLSFPFGYMADFFGISDVFMWMALGHLLTILFFLLTYKNVSVETSGKRTLSVDQ